MDDFELLRGDEGLGELKLRIPSPEAARWFLSAFHEEETLERGLANKGFIPEGTALLQELAEMNRDLVRKALGQEVPPIDFKSSGK